MLIVICEDDIHFADSLKEKIHLWADRHDQAVDIQFYTSSEDMLEAWRRGMNPDLFLLDIQFKSEMNGIQAAKLIRETDQFVPIIFISITDAYSLDGYTVMALRYLQKPVSYDEISQCLDVAFNRFILTQHKFLILSKTGTKYALPVHQIKYIEAHFPIVRIVGDHQLGIIEVRLSFKDVAQRLPDGLFVQCHRSIIVNLLHVRSIKRREITLSENVVLPISRMFANEVGKAFDMFYQEGGRFALVDDL